MNADKNLGTCLLRTEHATERAVSDHLGNQRTYRRLSEDEALGQQRAFERMFHKFPDKYKEKLSEPELQYLLRGLLQRSEKLARFYLTGKVHKTPINSDQ